MEKNCSNYFSDTINSSGIEEDIIKQINTLKPLDMEHRKYDESYMCSRKNLI